MGGRKAVRAALAGILLAASAACSDSSADKASPTATVATEPPPTTTPDPYAVPAVIDVAYVNKVLAGLDAVEGDIVRLIFQTKTILPEAMDRMKAIFADPDRLQRAIDGFQRDIRNDFAGYKPNPGNKVTSVTALLTAKPSCIFSRVSRDYSAVGTNPLPNLDVQWVALAPLDTARDPNGLNPTRWALTYDGFPADRSQPPNPCAS